MTEKHNWISDGLWLIEETTGVKLVGTLRRDISFIAKQLNDANDSLVRLEKEKEQLQERNNRQAEYIDMLFNLIEKQEWEMLTSILNEFKESHEQLQREWKGVLE